MSITKQEVEAAQASWGAGIIRIGKAHSEGGDYVGAAREHLKTLYGYHLGDVVFKPTLAAEEQFRNDVEGALSYFVGGNEKYAEDGGFAIKGWTAVRFENCGILCQESTAQAMGNYFFTGPDGSVTKVEYSFGYIRDDSGISSSTCTTHRYLTLAERSAPVSKSIVGNGGGAATVKPWTSSINAASYPK